MLEWISVILTKIVEWLIPFVLGLLFRKKVGRFFVKKKKWLLNDVVTFKMISVRSYNPVEIRDLNRDVYEDVKTKIPNAKLHDIFADGMRIAVPNFGILRLYKSKIMGHENVTEEEERVEEIKVTLQPESPVRLGIREMHLMNDFAYTAETLFAAVERLFVTHSITKQNYTILEFPRLGRFVEDGTFEIEDDDLGAHVHATLSKLTIVVEPTSQIAKATGKYLLV